MKFLVLKTTCYATSIKQHRVWLGPFARLASHFESEAQCRIAALIGVGVVALSVSPSLTPGLSSQIVLQYGSQTTKGHNITGGGIC